MRFFNRWVVGIFLAITVVLPSWVGDYHLGEGYAVGNVNIAGYGGSPA